MYANALHPLTSYPSAMLVFLIAVGSLVLLLNINATVQVEKLNLDNCRTGGSLSGLTDEYISLADLSLNGTEIRSLLSFPSLPSLKKVRALHFCFFGRSAAC
jgi:hypothetical protein